MHELTIMYKMVEMADKVAAENNVKQVESVSIEVGELSGVIPIFLEKCYTIAIDKYERFKDSKLLVTMIPAKWRCNHCGQAYAFDDPEESCPVCGHKERMLAAGDEFIVQNIVPKAFEE